MSSAKETTAALFETDVLASRLPVLVDFWAAWCGPCKMMVPVIDTIAEIHKDTLAVYKVNVDVQPALAARYQITAIPTLVMFKQGVAVDRFIGYSTLASLEESLKKHLV